MFLLKDTMQWHRWGSNLLTLGLESSTIPLSYCATYHPLWFRDDAVTKSAKEPISYIVMQRWCYYQNLPKSQYHPLWCRDDAVTKSAKEPISYIVIQRWCYYQICQRANTIHCDAEMMLLPNLPKSQYHPLWCRDDAVTKSAKDPCKQLTQFLSY